MSNASPLLRPKLHSESDPLSVCFPKPLVTPAKDTWRERVCRSSPPPPQVSAQGSCPGESREEQGEGGCSSPGKRVTERTAEIKAGEHTAGSGNEQNLHLPPHPFPPILSLFRSTLCPTDSGCCRLATEGNTEASPPGQAPLGLLLISNFIIRGQASPRTLQLQINATCPAPAHCKAGNS